VCVCVCVCMCVCVCVFCAAQVLEVLRLSERNMLKAGIVPGKNEK
jgi:hypothetical protein